MAGRCSWPMGYGASLDFEVSAYDQSWRHNPGLYIFAYRIEGGWRAVYVGQADSLRTVLSGHIRRDDILRAGATHVHTKVVRQDNQRVAWMRTLIEMLQPPLNAHNEVNQQSTADLPSLQPRESVRSRRQPSIRVRSLSLLRG